MAALERHGEIDVLDLGSDANRVNPEMIAAVHAALDELVARPAPRELRDYAADISKFEPAMAALGIARR